MSESLPPEPPRTGDDQIDSAMAEVRQLEELPAEDHHDVLSRAHDRLHDALQREPVTPDSE
jgi:hypothetical protein